MKDAARKFRETDLYEPVKRLLEDQGYEVKSEIGACDVVGVRGDEDPVIVELKTGFSLSLFHQAIERQRLTDAVYVAAQRGAGRAFQKALRSNERLCRRLGIGLILVRLRDGLVEVIADPAPYKPRPFKAGRTRLLREFSRRAGDPNVGGATRRSLMTAYRQDALRCAVYLSQNGPAKAAIVAAMTQVTTARRVMSDNHHGWFVRLQTGIYDLSPKGAEALIQHDPSVDGLRLEPSPPIE